MVNGGSDRGLREAGNYSSSREFGPFFEEDIFKVKGEGRSEITIDRDEGDYLGGVRGSGIEYHVV